jgi:hypothetical protein
VATIYSAKQHQREKIGVDDDQAKQQQASLEHLKQQQSSQSQKQLSTATIVKDKSNPIGFGDTEKTPNQATSAESDNKINPIKMAAAVEAGVAITEISTTASALSGAIPSTSVAAAHAAPVAAGLAAPLFGFF